MNNPCLFFCFNLPTYYNRGVDSNMFMPIQPFGRKGVLENPSLALVLLFLLFDAVIFFLGEGSMQR